MKLSYRLLNCCKVSVVVKSVVIFLTRANFNKHLFERLVSVVAKSVVIKSVNCCISKKR